MAAVLLATTCTAVAVPLNPNNSKAEFRSYFEDMGVTHLIVPGGSSASACEVAKERKIPIFEILDGRRLKLPDSGNGSKATQWAKPNRDDIAIILLTSGSTGRPKKVPLSHGNICVSAADICETLGFPTRTYACACGNNSTLEASVDLLVAPLAVGGQIVCTKGFNVDTFFKVMASHKPTWFQGVPATLYPLSVRTKSTRPATSFQLALHSVSCVGTGSKTHAGHRGFVWCSSCPNLWHDRSGPADHHKPSAARSAKTGLCWQVLRSGNPHRGSGWCDSCHTEKSVKLSSAGQMFSAAMKTIRRTNAKSFRNGWFRTGDTGFMDEDGYLFLRGRIKEMINRGGEKIGPFEVEEALLQHSAIAQAAVFSVAHKTLGEDIAAVVVLKPNLRPRHNDAASFPV